MKSIEDLIKKIKFVVFDFDGVFTNNQVIVNENGAESVVCNRSDGLGLAKLKELKLGLLILSKEANKVVLQRAKKLGLDCINGCDDKLVKIQQEACRCGLSLNEVAFVGNDINDADCLNAVGFPIVVADSHPDVAILGKYKTRALGGCGAVREVCDMIYKVKKGT